MKILSESICIFKYSNLLNNFNMGLKNAAKNMHMNKSKDEYFNMNRVLILTKMTRYEYERVKFKELNDQQFERKLRNRGTNFEKLKHHHSLQKTSVEKIAKCLRDMGSDVRIVNRYSFDKDAVSWADCVVPAGGDGTFLLAASLIRNNTLPVIGVNSDPHRSEGFLCLPKKYSINPRDAFEQLKSGAFKWTFRNRIRSKVIGNTRIDPKMLYDTPFYDVERIIGKEWDRHNNTDHKVLPVLALNEVFIGETLSAKVSHLELNFDNSDRYTNTKCSGICICTGTGSTSWHYSINRIPVQTVTELLKLMDMQPTEGKNSLATFYAEQYNQNLKFAPDDQRMGFSIRDLISAGVWPDPKGLKSRGFAEKIVVKSNCDDAYIVVDGGLSFSFNDGTLAVFEMHPEDRLRTVKLD